MPSGLSEYTGTVKPRLSHSHRRSQSAFSGSATSQPGKSSSVPGAKPRYKDRLAGLCGVSFQTIPDHTQTTGNYTTIPEASQLILQAATMGQGGEIFVLDMGEPVRIVDLAEDMIRLSGKEVGKDIQIVFTGLRPGEKLREELLYDDEALASGGHEKIFLAHPQIVALDWLEQRVQHLIACCRAQDNAGAQRLLQELVPEYRPDVPVAAAAPEPETMVAAAR